MSSMSAEDVYKALQTGDDVIGLATVYRVLTQFETAGWLNGTILKVAVPYWS